MNVDAFANCLRTFALVAMVGVLSGCGSGSTTASPPPGGSTPPPALASTRYSIQAAHTQAAGIAVGSDGNIWFAECPWPSGRLGAIVKTTTSGQMTTYPLSGSPRCPQWVTLGPDNAIWFTEASNGNVQRLGRIDTGGAITEYPLVNGDQPIGITLGSDGNLWYDALTNLGAGVIRGFSPTTHSIVGSVFTTGLEPVIGENNITTNPADGNVIITEGGQVWRIVPGANPTISVAYQSPNGCTSDVNDAAIGGGGNFHIQYGSTGNSNANIFLNLSQAGYTSTVIQEQTKYPPPQPVQKTVYLGPLAYGPDGNLYCWAIDANSQPALIALSTSGGILGIMEDGASDDGAMGTIVGPDGNIWLSISDRLGSGSLLKVSPAP